MTGAHIFVAVIYLILGASFVASTGVLINEFQTSDWFSMVVAHSHLFFFPVFSISGRGRSRRALQSPPSWRASL